MTIHAASASPDINSLLAADDLRGAVALMIDAVRQGQGDLKARLILIDLLILSGDLERADKQAAMAASLAPVQTVGLSLLRREIRGMDARRRWYEEAALPDFAGGPSEADRLAVKLSLALRERDEAGAGEARQALGALPVVQLSWNGAESGDFRDLDDRLPHALEVITSGGAYLWVDFAKIAHVEFAPDARPRDLAWRRARLRLQDGSVADVLVPALYHGQTYGQAAPTHGQADGEGNGQGHLQAESDALRLGRETFWVDGPAGLVSGIGQRCFLAGDLMVAISEAVTITPGGNDA